MDTQKDCKSAEFLRSTGRPENKVIVGAKQIRKALNAGKAHRVFLAENADPAITEPLVALCQQNHVLCTWVSDMSELGHACGIAVGAAAAAVVA